MKQIQVTLILKTQFKIYLDFSLTHKNINTNNTILYINITSINIHQFTTVYELTNLTIIKKKMFQKIKIIRYLIFFICSRLAMPNY